MGEDQTLVDPRVSSDSLALWNAREVDQRFDILLRRREGVPDTPVGLPYSRGIHLPREFCDAGAMGVIFLPPHNS